MPIYLILAYVTFCVVPLYVGIRTSLRYRRVLREIDKTRPTNHESTPISANPERLV